MRNSGPIEDPGAFRMPQSDTPPAPAVERIATLDLVRGLAVLGILAVNAGGFAATLSAYGSPGLWPFPDTGASAAAPLAAAASSTTFLAAWSAACCSPPPWPPR